MTTKAQAVLGSLLIAVSAATSLILIPRIFRQPQTIHVPDESAKLLKAIARTKFATRVEDVVTAGRVEPESFLIDVVRSAFEASPTLKLVPESIREQARDDFAAFASERLAIYLNSSLTPDQIIEARERRGDTLRPVSVLRSDRKIETDEDFINLLNNLSIRYTDPDSVDAKAIFAADYAVYRPPNQTAFLDKLWLSEDFIQVNFLFIAADQDPRLVPPQFTRGTSLVAEDAWLGTSGAAGAHYFQSPRDEHNKLNNVKQGLYAELSTVVGDREGGRHTIMFGYYWSPASAKWVVQYQVVNNLGLSVRNETKGIFNIEGLRALCNPY